MPMKRELSNTIYTDEPLGDYEIIPDFLPKPWELARMEKKSKVTITLSDESVAFFKKQAKKYGTPYQAMIRNLLQHYVMQAQRQKPNRS
jgi:predicted DNA binding CopG/RHH family protein